MVKNLIIKCKHKKMHIGKFTTKTLSDYNCRSAVNLL